jgi:hypothetical protein
MSFFFPGIIRLRKETPFLYYGQSRYAQQGEATQTNAKRGASKGGYAVMASFAQTNVLFFFGRFLQRNVAARTLFDRAVLV